MNSKVSWAEPAKSYILQKKCSVALKWFYGVNSEVRRQSLGQQRVVSNSGADIHEASVGGDSSDKLDEDVFFI